MSSASGAQYGGLFLQWLPAGSVVHLNGSPVQEPHKINVVPQGTYHLQVQPPGAPPVAVLVKVNPGMVTSLGGAAPAQPTIDQILVTPATTSERDAALACLNLTIDPSIPAATQEAIRACFVNLMRAWRRLTFDVSMPLLDMANLYDWYCAYGVPVHVFAGSGLSHGDSGTGRLFVQGDIFGPDFRCSAWGAPGGGLVDLGALMVHEAWHIVGDGGRGIGHDCIVARPAGPPGIGGSTPAPTFPVDDSSLPYNGAWAVEYWYFRWLADHSGTALTAAQKTQAALEARNIATSRFCMAPPDNPAPPPSLIGPHAPRPMAVHVTLPVGGIATLDGVRPAYGNTAPEVGPAGNVQHFFAVAPGDHTLSVVAPGYAPWVYRITMTRGDMNIAPTLVRARV